MKKRIWLGLLLLCALVLTACGHGSGDWSYPLPNGYEIWHVYSQSITFGQRRDDTLDTVVDGYVRAFCYGERFVGLQMSEAADGEDVLLFLVDTENHSIYAANDETEFRQTCESLSAMDLGDWISTKPAPRGAE